MDGEVWWAAVHGVAKSQTRLSDFTFTFHFHALEKEMATHSSVLAWRIPGTGQPGGLPSMGLHRVRHDWTVLAAAAGTKGEIGFLLLLEISEGEKWGCSLVDYRAVVAVWEYDHCKLPSHPEKQTQSISNWLDWKNWGSGRSYSFLPPRFPLEFTVQCPSKS